MMSNNTSSHNPQNLNNHNGLQSHLKQPTPMNLKGRNTKSQGLNMNMVAKQDSSHHQSIDAYLQTQPISISSNISSQKQSFTSPTSLGGTSILGGATNQSGGTQKAHNTNFFINDSAKVPTKTVNLLTRQPQNLHRHQSMQEERQSNISAPLYLDQHTNHSSSGSNNSHYEQTKSINSSGKGASGGVGLSYHQQKQSFDYEFSQRQAQRNLQQQSQQYNTSTTRITTFSLNLHQVNSDFLTSKQLLESAHIDNYSPVMHHNPYKQNSCQDCTWRQSYEEEHEALMRVQNYTQSLQKELENERKQKSELMNQLENAMAKIQFFEHQNNLLQQELRNKSLEDQRMTINTGFSNILDNSTLIFQHHQRSDGLNSIKQARSNSPPTENSLLYSNNQFSKLYQLPHQTKQLQTQTINLQNLRNSLRQSHNNLTNSRSTGNNSLEDENEMRNPVNIQVMRNTQLRNSQKGSLDSQPNFFQNNNFSKPSESIAKNQNQNHQRQSSLNDRTTMNSSNKLPSQLASGQKKQTNMNESAGVKEQQKTNSISALRSQERQGESQKIEINIPLQRERGKSFKHFSQKQERKDHKSRSRSRINSYGSSNLQLQYNEADPINYSMINQQQQNQVVSRTEKQIKMQALKKFKSGENLPTSAISLPQQNDKATDSMVQLRQPQNNKDGSQLAFETHQQQIQHALNSQNPYVNQINATENISLDRTVLDNLISPYIQKLQSPETIQTIFQSQSRALNFKFSQFKMALIGEQPEVQFIKLKHDPVRAIQSQALSRIKRQRKLEDQSNYSMTQAQMQSLKNAAHQVYYQNHPHQHAHSNKYDIDPRFQNLQISSSPGYINSIEKRGAHPKQYESQSNNRYNQRNYHQDEEDVIMENEEDEDCQVIETNRTFEHSYGFQGSDRRHNVVFQNDDVMMYQSPNQKRPRLLPANKQSSFHDRLTEEDLMMQETQRILDHDPHKKLLLATPTQRVEMMGNSLIEKAKEIYRAAEYSDNQKKEMEKSIINRSTNKKLRRQKFLGGASTQVATIKLERKNIESFRGESHNVIKEEQNNFSDEDNEEMQNTPSAVDSKEKSLSLGESKLIKNPTYARITHASKQMEFLGQQKPGGQTISFKNFDNSQMSNPLLKSMPNLDKLKRQEIHLMTQTHLFDEASQNERLQQSTLQHSNTLIDINQNNVQIHPKHHTRQTTINHHAITPLLNTKMSSKFQEQHGEVPSPGFRTGSSNKLFEEFFVIGVTLSDLNKIDWGKCPAQYVEPKTLYMYSNQSEDSCDRRRVVKDFCFPDGVEVRKIKSKGEGFTDQQKSIYSKIFYQTKNLREQCFIFTMNANEDGASDNISLTKSRTSAYFQQAHENLETFPEGGSQDKYLNCICVVLNELVQDSSFDSKNQLNESQLEKGFQQSSIYGAKKAYCFMFSNHFYQLHLEVINLLINVHKYSTLQSADTILAQSVYTHMRNYNHERQIQIELIRDIHANLQTRLVTPDMQTILNQCFNLDLEMQTDMIQIDFSRQIGSIKYELPSILDVPFLEHSWFCPQLFQLFTPAQFLQLLSAVLLEKSIIFVGKANLISSTILGLNCLLYPFKWCFAIVPVLPHPLIDMIEAPVPILVGITKREHRELKLTQEEKASKTWVYVETGHIIWSQDYQPEKCTLFFDNILEKIESDYSTFSKDQFKVVRDTELSTHRDSFVNSFNDFNLESARSSCLQDLSVVYNDKQKEICRSICLTIRQNIKLHILEGLKAARKNPSLYKSDNLVESMGQMVVKSCKCKQDKEFLDLFVLTQMFSAYVEELF